MPTQRQAGLMDKRSSELQRSHSATLSWKTAMGVYQNLPGLRGFWPMSAITTSIANGTVSAVELSGQLHPMLAVGSPQFVYTSQISYYQAAGANAYLAGGNQDDYRIIGNESFVSASQQGLTLGTWVKFTTLSVAQEALIAKDDGAGLSFSYYLEKLFTNEVRFVVTGDGAALTGVTSPEQVGTTDWHLVIGRFDADAAAISIFMDGVKVTETNGVPATLYDSEAQLRIGYETQTATGTSSRYLSMAFICGMSLEDYWCQAIWYHTAPMFGR